MNGANDDDDDDEDDATVEGWLAHRGRFSQFVPHTHVPPMCHSNGGVVKVGGGGTQAQMMMMMGKLDMEGGRNHTVGLAKQPGRAFGENK